MQLTDALWARRSIRKYGDIPISKEEVERVIGAGMQAPSAKNRQPWRFVVVQGAAKTEMIRAMADGLEREERQPLLPDSSRALAAARHTLGIMAKAPVSIFVLNPLAAGGELPTNLETEFYQMANLQSIGAAIQNMTLMAVELGLGSLWICDIFFAYPELCRWLGTGEQLVAALTLGVPTEKPHPRPRKSLVQLVQWREE